MTNSRGSEQGFTLIELLLAITISSIILVAIAGALIVAEADTTAPAVRFAESADAHLVGSWLTADVTSAAPGGVVIGGAPSTTACAGQLPRTGTNILSASWSDYESSVTYNAVYVLQASLLTRYFCESDRNGDAPSAINLAHNVASAQAAMSGNDITMTVSDSLQGAQYSFSASATSRTNEDLTIAAPSLLATNTAIPATSIIATLTGGTANPAISGTLSFGVFGPQAAAPSSCTSGGTGVGTGTEINAGNGNYSPSAGFTPSAPGDYWWYVSYPGDTNNTAATSLCPPLAETTVLNTTTTTITAPASASVNVAIPASSFSATLSGATTTPTPTGSINFVVFGPQATPPAAATCNSAGQTFANASVTGNGNYSPSAGFTPSAPGDYWWYTQYTGDTLNSDSNSPCPPVVETVVS